MTDRAWKRQERLVAAALSEVRQGVQARRYALLAFDDFAMMAKAVRLDEVNT